MFQILHMWPVLFGVWAHMKLPGIAYMPSPWQWHNAQRMREKGSSGVHVLFLLQVPQAGLSSHVDSISKCPSNNKFSNIYLSCFFCSYFSNNSEQQSTRKDNIWYDLWIKQQNQTARSIDMAWHMNCKSTACFAAWCLSCVTHAGSERLPLEHQSCILSLLFSLRHRTVRHVH